MPQSAPSALLRVQGSSKLAFGATTAALVTLASGGTAVLVTHVAHGTSSPTSLPGGPLPPDSTAPPQGLVVGRLAGTPAPAPPVDATERALHEALTARRATPRRTLTAPLVPLPTTAPEVPTVTPPVVGPVVVPVTQPVKEPVTQPSSGPTHASRVGHGHGRSKGRDEGETERGHGRHAHPRPKSKGRHAH